MHEHTRIYCKFCYINVNDIQFNAIVQHNTKLQHKNALSGHTLGSTPYHAKLHITSIAIKIFNGFKKIGLL